MYEVYNDFRLSFRLRWAIYYFYKSSGFTVYASYVLVYASYV